MRPGKGLGAVNHLLPEFPHLCPGKSQKPLLEMATSLSFLPHCSWDAMPGFHAMGRRLQGPGVSKAQHSERTSSLKQNARRKQQKYLRGHSTHETAREPSAEPPSETDSTSWLLPSPGLGPSEGARRPAGTVCPLAGYLLPC